MRTRLPAALPLLLTAAIGAGCAAIVDRSTLTGVAPAVMATDDVGLGCSSGEGTAGLLSSFGKPEKGQTPHLAQVLTLLSAAMCVEPLAWEAELERGVALHRGEGARVQDLLEVERRHHTEAARRYLSAWTHLQQGLRLDELDDAGCPKRVREKHNEDLLMLLGLSSGVLAVLHDQAGGMEIGVPLDVPRKVARLGPCLPNEAWWGVPRALQAAVWATIPGAAPEGEDPLAVLAQSAALGDAAGVRLARAFQVQTLATIGDEAALQAAIAAHAAALATPPNPRFRMLDRFATLLIRHESDKLWVRTAGHRTPGGQLGAFPATSAPAEDASLDDLLDSLLPSPAPAAPPPAPESP